MRGKWCQKLWIVLVEANRASGKMCFSEGLGLNLSDYKCSIISYEQISRSSRKEVPMPGDQGRSEGCCTCSIARSNLVNFFISSTTFGYILHNAPHQALPIVNNPSPFINKSVIFLTYEYLNFLTLPCLGSTFVLDISNLSKDQFSFVLMWAGLLQWWISISKRSKEHYIPL